MTVERLIKELQKYNPKAIVKMHHRDGEPVLFVLAIVGDEERVWLESESDSDMKAELEARFELALDEYDDELDVYIDMLETGITVDTIHQYLGHEYADYMQRFCEEHGLI